MEENTNTAETKVPPTEEQILEFETKMTEFYNKRLPFLRIKAEYERLNSEIAQDNLKELIAVQQHNKIKADLKFSPTDDKK